MKNYGKILNKKKKPNPTDEVRVKDSFKIKRNKQREQEADKEIKEYNDYNNLDA